MILKYGKFVEYKHIIDMRLPKENEDLTNKICVCSIGRVAVVTGKGYIEKEGEKIPVWNGLGLDGKGNWASTKPAVVAESGEEFHDKLRDRFSGKMSFNG